MPPPADEPDLGALLALMQAGDLRALDQLVRAYGRRLLAVARRRCRRAADAEDAVQQALLAASSAMTSYRGEGSPLAWLATLVSRSCYRLNEGLAPPAEAGDRPCGCEDPERVAERAELGVRLGGALMRLSRTDRLAFVLAAEGFTSGEIAERFGLSADGVRSRLKRSRKRLRAWLGDDTPGGRRDTTTHANPADLQPPVDR
jgi:RNA polymerase sigma-70 factor (ECF subfamily)